MPSYHIKDFEALVTAKIDELGTMIVCATAYAPKVRSCVRRENGFLNKLRTSFFRILNTQKTLNNTLNNLH